MTNIYVGNLPYATHEEDLVQHFSQWGQVERATLVFDRETGRPRGFGFVEMEDSEAARVAIEEAHGEPLNGRPLTVNEARPRGSGSQNTSQSASGHSQPRPSGGYQNQSAPKSQYTTPTPPATPSTPSPQRPSGGGYANYLYA